MRMGKRPVRCPASPVRVVVTASDPSRSGATTEWARSLLEGYRVYVQLLGPGASPGADVVLLDAGEARRLVVDSVVRTVEQSTRPVLVVLDPHDSPDVPSDRLGSAVGSEDSDERSVLRLLRAGARGCVIRPDDPLRLLEAIVTVASGEVALDHHVAVRAAALSARLIDLDRSPADLLGLSRRELEVLERLDGGSTARMIGSELYVSHETVRSHLKRIYRKLGVHDRAAAVERARLDGLLPR